MTNADLPIFQGDTFDGVVFVSNDDGTPADLAGFDARAQIRRQPADQDPTVAAEIGVTIVLPDRVFLKLTSAQTTLLAGKYVWDLQLMNDDGAVATVIGGKVAVAQEVTRDASTVPAGARYYAREVLR